MIVLSYQISAKHLLGEFKYRRPPASYQYKYPVYDLCMVNGFIVIPFYQNNKIVFRPILNTGHEPTCPYACSIESCHSVTQIGNRLLVSSHRKPNISSYDISSGIWDNMVVFKDFNPIGVGLVGNQLVAIDYLNSQMCLLTSELSNKEKKDLTPFLDGASEPHSIKSGFGITCVTMKRPSQLLIYRSIGFPHKKFLLPKGIDALSAQPISRNKVLIAGYNQGIFCLDLRTGDIVNVYDGEGVSGLTCAMQYKDKIICASESSAKISVLKHYLKPG